MAVLGLAACNSTAGPACRGGCSSSGGASDESAAGAAAVDARGSDPPGCTSNDDCDNGRSSCDNALQCIDGKCTTGKAFACPPLSKCSDEASGVACVYPPGERFIVYGVDDLNPWWNLVGTSVSDLAHPTQVNLSLDANDTEFSALSGFTWSTDGRRLVFPTVHFDQSTGDFEQRFFWFDFTRPLAGQPRRLPDVPLNADYSASGWSPDANAVLIGRNDFGRVDYYAVRFEGAGAETALVPTDGQVELCSDDTTVAYEANGSTHFASLWNSPVTETVLPALLRGRSPDGRWLLLSDDGHAYLVACGLKPKLEQLAGPAAIAGNWSSDSRYVVYSEEPWDSTYTQDETEEKSSKTLNGFRVQSAATHTPVFQATAASPAVSFEPGGSRFTYLALTESGEHVRHLEKITNPELDQVVHLEDARGNPIVPTIDWLGATGRLVYDTEAATFTLKTSPSATPRELPLTTSGLGSSAVIAGKQYSKDRTKLIWVATESSDKGVQSQVYSLDLEDEQSLAHALFSKPVSGSLGFAAYNPDPRILYRTLDFVENNVELFVVPEDYQGTPVAVRRGSVLDVDASVSLQPQP
ncbi:MAG: hypothetical protein ABI627_20735 [Polyangiaceae bacterium]